MDINFKGYVPMTCETVSLDLKRGYSPAKGPNAGKKYGDVLFIVKGTPTKRAVYSDAQSALLDVIDEVPDGTKVYANGTYMPIEKAAELELTAYGYKAATRAEPYWSSLGFYTAEAIAKMNGGAKTPTAKKAAKAAPANLPKF